MFPSFRALFKRSVCRQPAVALLLLFYLSRSLSAENPERIHDRPAGQQLPPQPKLQSPPRLQRIHPSADGTHFVIGKTDQRFVPWGVNYDHDRAGRLLEDYWETEWATVREDFQEIQALGANLIRIHLQLGKFMESAEKPNPANLARLKQLIQLAEELDLYLDLTGLGCYHKQDVPAWYDALEEAPRWEVQARFWQAIATVGHGNSAVFCYDLMNEPITSDSGNSKDWLAGEPLGGKYFVQRITLQAAGREENSIAKAWLKKLTDSIRTVDPSTMITLGVIPWAQVFPGAKPIFYAPEVCGPLDFVSIHLYPRTGKLKEDLAVLKLYQIGKPVVIEEIFPLSASAEQTFDFIEGSQGDAAGWVSFYWGTTIDQAAQSQSPTEKLIGSWLQLFQAKSATMKNR